MQWLDRTIASAALFLLPLCAAAQAAGSDRTGWSHLQALPPHVRVHISTDTGGHTCSLFAVTEDALICTRHSKAGAVYARPTVKTVKLTRYTVSTLAGLAGGAGIGALIGRATVRKSNPGFDLNFSELNIAFGAVIGGLAGPAITGPADLLRGPTIYRRP